MKRLIILPLLCVVGDRIDPSSVIVPCKKNDHVCMTMSANKAAQIIAAGIPSLGVDGFDPAYLREVSGEASKFIFNLTENVITGYTKCSINDVMLNLELWKLKFDLICPSLVTAGHMVASGELLDVPVEGDADYKMICGKYLLKIDIDIKKTKGADGRSHLALTTFKHQEVPLEPSKYQYDNFKSKKQLSPEAAAVFEEKKFPKGAEFILAPYVDKLFKEVIFKSVNKFLESIPFEDLFLD